MHLAVIPTSSPYDAAIMTEFWTENTEIDGGTDHSFSLYPTLFEGKSIKEIHDQLGKAIFKRMYSMNFESFRLLVFLLKPTFEICGGELTYPFDICLLVALRCFRGGSQCDVAQIHGMTMDEAFECVSLVEETINEFYKEFEVEIKKGSNMMQKVRKLVRHYLY